MAKGRRDRWGDKPLAISEVALILNINNKYVFVIVREGRQSHESLQVQAA